MTTRPKILVIRCGAVGDTVMATCVLDPLLAYFPGAKIEWLATPISGPLFTRDDRVSVILLKHRKLPIFLSREKRCLIGDSRREPYRLILNLETAPFFSKLVHSLHAQEVWGYGDGAIWEDKHGVENHRTVLLAAGLSAQNAYPHLIAGSPPQGIPERYVVIHPGNSHVRSSRKVNIRAWPEEKWRKLLLELVDAGVNVIVTGSADELSIARAVAGSEGLCLAGQTDLSTLMALLNAALSFVSSDTGPIHIAASLGTPIIGLYGPTRDSQTAPFGRAGQVTLIRHHTECSPCYGTPLEKTCEDNRCMKGIEVPEVLSVVLDRIACRDKEKV